MVRFINKCVKIEDTAAMIYQAFAKSTECDAVLREIWKTMARDEEEHAQQLRLASRLPIEEVFDGHSDKCPDPDVLINMSTEMLGRAEGGTMSTLEMLQDAVKLEKDFRKIHATYALVFRDPRLLKTFDRLARADREHLEALDAYLKKFKEDYKK